ncbi:hypothetical protein AAVH_30529 [Aphelenchoides avenae]|nr:hypothetical protein AAVH_30529 [Aphelenchus avenae]
MFAKVWLLGALFCVANALPWHSVGGTYFGYGCTVVNGMVYEGSGAPRPLTSEERSEVDRYEREMQQWGQQAGQIGGRFGQQMGQWNPFSGQAPTMAPFPDMPTPPCICSSCSG